MLSSVRIRRGQTAVEMLFILGIVLTGVLMVIPTYVNEDSNNIIVVSVRDAASMASTYLNTGVERSGSPYNHLNEIMKYTNHSPSHFRFLGVRVQRETGNSVELSVKFEHDLALGDDDNRVIAKNLGEFILNYLPLNNKRFTVKNGTVYSNGKMIVLNVTVNGLWVVVP